MKKVFTVPNILTFLRIIGSLCLIFIEPLSLPFLVLYTLCGVSDVLDGVIARATNSTSELGSKLDSIADIIYYLILLLRILPTLWTILPREIWLFVALTLLVRVLAYTVAFIRYKKFASLHTYFNKATGFAIFLVPYMIIWDKFAVVYCVLVCTVGFLASLEELMIHIIRKDYKEGARSIFEIKSKK